MGRDEPLSAAEGPGVKVGKGGGNGALQPPWCWGLQASSPAEEVQVVEVCELYTQVVLFECSRRQQVRELGLCDPHGARRPHADPTWASLKVAPPRQRGQMRGLQRGSPFLLCLGYGGCRGTQTGPCQEPVRHYPQQTAAQRAREACQGDIAGDTWPGP